MRALLLPLLLLLATQPLAVAQGAAEREDADADADADMDGELEGAAAAAPWPAEPAGGPRYVVEAIVVRGNAKTEEAFIRGELAIAPGDVVTPADPRIESSRVRLLALGHFLDVRFSLDRGARRGAVVLVVNVEERGTVVVNAIHLGTSEATALFGGLDVAERNFLGRGILLGAGFVLSTEPRVEEARPGRAFALRAGGPTRAGVSLSGGLVYNRGSELFRAQGRRSSADPDDFVALRTGRFGGRLGVAFDLSRTARLYTDGRFESVDADWPSIRTQESPSGAISPIAFGVQEGRSRLGTVAVVLDVDTRSDPVLPRSGGRASITLEAAVPVIGSRYSYAKGVVQGAWYRPLRRGHVLGFHGFAGAIFGEAPYFERFFVGDLNFLLPPRALGLNFSTLPSRNLLGTSIAEHRYDPFAARALVEYSVPLWRRRGFVYRGDAFATLGVFGLASLDDLRMRDRSLRQSIPIDLTADLGLRLDTYVGIFTLSIANALGRVPL
jgi:hypothetical protein